jgi:hypothetical protein
MFVAVGATVWAANPDVDDPEPAPGYSMVYDPTAPDGVRITYEPGYDPDDWSSPTVGTGTDDDAWWMHRSAVKVMIAAISLTAIGVGKIARRR